MMKSHSHFLRSGIVLTAVLFAACDEEAPTPIADETVQEIEADYIVWGMDNRLTLNGVRSGHVIADSATGVRDSSTVDMTGVQMSLYNDQGIERATVDANTGVFDQRTEELMAYGDVVLLVPDQGVRIESSMLGYDPARDEIWSDSVTLAVINGAPTQGTCFRSDLQFTGWTVCDPRGEIPSRAPGSDTTSSAEPARASETGPPLPPADSVPATDSVPAADTTTADPAGGEAPGSTGDTVPAEPADTTGGGR